VTNTHTPHDDIGRTCAWHRAANIALSINEQNVSVNRTKVVFTLELLFVEPVRRTFALMNMHVAIHLNISRSAVAERPRDALCPSVVGVVFLLLLRRLQIYHCVQLNPPLLSLA